jgi:phytoene dehydrogenase-like protein
MKYDVIVIGAGLGGLTAGAKLATSGKKVLLVEQHDRPGGCATTFRRRDFTMEVGLHEMDGLHPADTKTKIFQELGIADRVGFLELPEFYRFVNGRQDLVIPHDPEQAATILKNAFPGEEKGIDSYFYHLANARKIMIQQRDEPDKSVGTFLDEIITNDELKLVLLGNLAYFHDDPYSLSWLYYLTAQGSYYRGRANFIKGGSQQLSSALMEVILEHGGEVKLNSLVTSIHYKGKTPAGITFREIRGKAPTTSTVYGKEIIVNAAVPTLAEQLLSPSDGKKLAAGYSGNRIGASLLTVYYGFNKPLREVGNQHYSTFVFDHSVNFQEDILPNNHADFSRRSFTLVDYSQVDSRLTQGGKGVGAVCCVDYPEDWENLGKEEYNRLKGDVADTFTERCERLIPGFRDAVEYAEVGTSLTVNRFTLNPKGAVYGFAQHPGKSMQYLNSLPSNIHIASAWGKYGGGFSGAILSGYMTALELLRSR